jgi:hypothetical protein
MSQPAAETHLELPATVRRGRLSIMWRPNLALGDEGFLPFYRVLMIGLVVSPVVGLLGLVLGLAALAGAAVPLSIVQLCTAAMIGAIAVHTLARTGLLFRQGGWRGLYGPAHCDEERPKWFWWLVAFYAALGAACLGLSVVSFWIAASAGSLP